jgi:xanthine dehydrogenase accessory factor
MTHAGPPADALPLDPEGQRLLERLPELLPPAVRTAVLVTVWAVDGSAPRSTGARMLCQGGRLLAGTIGGGHLEDQALRDAHDLEADRMRATDVDEPPASADLHEEATPQCVARVLRYPLGPQLAQCCGGVVRLHFQTLDTARASAMADTVRRGSVLETSFGGETLREIPTPWPTVLICGAGHVAAALARVLQPLPWRVVVVDQRGEWADPARFPPGTEVVCTEPLRLLATWGWLGDQAETSQAAQRLRNSGLRVPIAPSPVATAALVMTHEHALDRELVEALVRVPDRVEGDGVWYVGMIGSKSKVAAMRQRLRQRGVADDRLDRVTAPIGLRLGDGALLGGKLPGEIAIGVAAQLLALRQA